MKVVMIVDKAGSAIDILAKINANRMKHFDVVVLPFHPKRPSQEEILAVNKELQDANIIDFLYWKSACKIRELMPQLCEGKKMILTHQNEHNVEGDWDWKKYSWDAIVAKNEWQREKLKAQGYNPVFIRHAIEFDNFEYVPKLNSEKIVGFVGQVKKVKGVRELKQACDELGYRLMIVGRVSESAYWEELNKNNLLYYQNVSEKELAYHYREMRVFVCNSDDGTESGTLPILEAMLTGIPVVTRKIGHVRDFAEHGKNVYINQGHYTDIESLKAALKMVMENEDIANNIRDNAWRTVRQYHPDIHADKYEKLYYRILRPTQPLVSVIMPTCERPEVLKENLENLKNQSYKNFEVIICNDGLTKIELDKKYPFAVKIIWTEKQAPEYGLAKARNLGIIEAKGEILVFCDDRLKMHTDAITNFVKRLTSLSNKRTWLWGSKGVYKSFVENFSCAWRQEIINGGMFSERIDGYGGMTQEVSHRFGNQGWVFDFVPQSVAEAIITTHSKSNNRQSIIKQKIKLYKMGL